jgi:hypothetical protein
MKNTILISILSLVLLGSVGCAQNLGPSAPSAQETPNEPPSSGNPPPP